MPYHCRHCNGTYCADHRLPESHDCPALKQWENTGPVFDSGFDDRVLDDDSGGLAGRLGIDTGPGGPLAYFRGNMTYVVLLLMVLTYTAQLFTLPVLSPETWEAIFVFSPENPHYVWTWVTSIFAHSPETFVHILFNGIVIYFFGRIVEQYLGSVKFTLLFLVSGILAGAGQILYQIVLDIGGPGVVGASGAALALMGVVTILRPNLTVYFMFFLPMRIKTLTGAVVVISTALILAVGPGAGGIAHVAHLVGVLIGLAYGYRIRDRVNLPSQYRFGGPGGGGPGRSRGPGGPGGRF